MSDASARGRNANKTHRDEQLDKGRYANNIADKQVCRWKKDEDFRRNVETLKSAVFPNYLQFINTLPVATADETSHHKTSCT